MAATEVKYISDIEPTKYTPYLALTVELRHDFASILEEREIIVLQGGFVPYTNVKNATEIMDY